MSGTTSQPNLNSVVAALAHTERDTGLNFEALNRCSDYWETVRTYYAAFDNAPKSGSADVYVHEMPGGQYTNLREQAEAMGLGARWPEIARMYADVNFAFGDIVKVTPSSKVVGDLAIYLVSHNMTVDALLKLRPNSNLTLPNSVVDMLMGSLGQPEGGWPPKLQEVVLRGKKPIADRPGAHLPPVDLESAAREVESKTGSTSRTDLMSYLMYPDVFLKFAEARTQYGELDVLPTPQFLYGLEERSEVTVELEEGKSLIIRLLTVGEPKPDGTRSVFYELNGQPREVEIQDRSAKPTATSRRKAESSKPGDVGAPIPGAVTAIYVDPGQPVQKGDRLLIMEAMKMQTTVPSPVSGCIKEILVRVGERVDAHDLLVVVE